MQEIGLTAIIKSLNREEARLEPRNSQLAWTVVLGFVHIVAALHAASLQRGYRWAASARDHVVAPLTGVAGRLDRALRNFSETFPLFAALLLAAHRASAATAG